MKNDTNIKIFRQEVNFIAGAASVPQLPKLFLPQIVFWGKSNVGKSSLINSICRRKALARVSHTPGRTQQINFFSLADKLILVDFPGYGFAKVSKTSRLGWEKLIINYLENCKNLSMINLLIDARRGIKDPDIEAMDFIKSLDIVFQIVFTKADKISVNEKLLEEHKNLLASLGHSCNVIATSSRNGDGTKELQVSMLQCIK